MAIGLLLAGVMVIGVGTYGLFPMNYSLYNSDHVQNASASTRQSLGIVNEMVNVSPLLLLGGAFMAAIGIAIRSRGGGFFD